MNPIENDWDGINILLVEDNPGDIDLTKEAFEDATIRNRLHVVEDGEQALDFVFRKGALKARPAQIDPLGLEPAQARRPGGARRDLAQTGR